MALLAVSNVFIPGNIIRSSEVNQNNTDFLTWANGNITDVNFGTMTSTVSWSISTNAKAIDISNTGTTGSISIAQNAVLATGLSAVKVSSNSAQSAGNALVEIVSTSASDNIPALLITDIGTSGAAINVVSTTKSSRPVPKMTSSQRASLAGQAEGMEIYNSTTKRKEIYDGTNWVDAAGRTGEVVNFAGSTLPPDRLACNGASYLRASYPALFAKIGTTWGSADGTHFNVPDSQGKVSVGDGAGAGLTARALADTGGEETHTLITSEMPSHSHNVTLSSGSGPPYVNANLGNNAVGSSATSNTGSDGAHNNMQPYVVFKSAIII